MIGSGHMLMMAAAGGVGAYDRFISHITQRAQKIIDATEDIGDETNGDEYVLVAGLNSLLGEMWGSPWRTSANYLAYFSPGSKPSKVVMHSVGSGEAYFKLEEKNSPVLIYVRDAGGVGSVIGQYRNYYTSLSSSGETQWQITECIYWDFLLEGPYITRPRESDTELQSAKPYTW